MTQLWITTSGDLAAEVAVRRAGQHPARRRRTETESGAALMAIHPAVALGTALVQLLRCLGPREARLHGERGYIAEERATDLFRGPTPQRTLGWRPRRWCSRSIGGGHLLVHTSADPIGTWQSFCTAGAKLATTVGAQRERNLIMSLPPQSRCCAAGVTAKTPRCRVLLGKKVEALAAMHEDVEMSNKRRLLTWRAWPLGPRGSAPLTTLGEKRSRSSTPNRPGRHQTDAVSPICF